MTAVRANSLRAFFAVLLTLLVAVFVWRNWSQFVESARLVGDLPLAVYWVTLPLLFVTFGLAALSYRFLAFHRLPMRELYTIELTAALATRLIPSGVGGLGVHGLYLHKRKHTIAQATAAVSVNNLLGLVVHSLLLLGMLAFVDANIEFDFTWTKPMTLALACALLLLAVLASVPAVRRRMAGFGHGLLSSFDRYRKQPQSVLAAAGALAALTLVNVTILSVVSGALGISLGFPALFVVYSAGILLGAVVPTPGGFAGVEAGLAGGFIAYGVDTQTAIAAALAFRLITYWLPFIPGAIATILARKDKMV